MKDSQAQTRFERHFSSILDDPISYLDLEHRVYNEQRSAILLDLPCLPGMRVLDIGCGSGIWTQRIVTRLSGGGKVVGVDNSSQMISAATKRKERASPEHSEMIAYLLGDATNLPFRASTFDLVVAAGLFMYLRNTSAAMGELVRVTRPGGFIALTGDEELDTWIPSPFDLTLWSRFKDAMKKALETRAEQEVGFAFDQYFVRKYWRLFEHAGLVDIRLRAYEFHRVGRAEADLRQWLVKNLSAGWKLVEGNSILSADDKDILRKSLFGSQSVILKPNFSWQRTEFLIVGRKK